VLAPKPPKWRHPNQGKINIITPSAPGKRQTNSPAPPHYRRPEVQSPKSEVPWSVVCGLVPFFSRISAHLAGPDGENGMKNAVRRAVCRWPGLAGIGLRTAKKANPWGVKMFKKSLRNC
jgi:hypothetical protein